MSTKHTPGPWYYQATAGNHDYIIWPESASERDVALVRGEHLANARLIAAAPDLLEAVCGLMEAIRDTKIPPDCLDQIDRQAVQLAVQVGHEAVEKAIAD